MPRHVSVRHSMNCLALLCLLVSSLTANGYDLAEVKQAGVLRHLGIPYAYFITADGNGLDVELIQGFAAHLGVEYRYIESSLERILGDLTGINAKRGDNGAAYTGRTNIKGDVIANGMTILPWRQEVVSFSAPTFPSAVWLIADAYSSLHPITPTGSLERDIELVKERMDGISVLTLRNTCLDPKLYQLEEANAQIRYLETSTNLNEMAPAVISGTAETSLLDVPGALIALHNWPDKLKVVGPVSNEQRMAAGFRQDSPELLRAFNTYLKSIREDGSYNRLVAKYYPTAFDFYADFFQR